MSVWRKRSATNCRKRTRQAQALDHGTARIGILATYRPNLLHSLRTLFDARSSALRREALVACEHNAAASVPVKFFHRCMEVTAFYDRLTDRFTQLQACDIADVGMESPTYCITLRLFPVE